jgi:trimeric autotransporter adhesin
LSKPKTSNPESTTKLKPNEAMRTLLKLTTLALLACSTLNYQLSTAFAQGTAFTYQGRLNDGGSPAHGTYDFRFKLFEDSLGNTQAGSTQLAGGVPVTNGLFLVTIDFGAGIFTGSNYWLEVDVRTNGAASYTGLTPLQAVTPTPYAIFANTASNLSGTLPAGQLSGMVPSANLTGTYGNAVTFNNAGNSFSGNGSGLTGVNAATLNGLGAGNFWQTGGNAGTTAGPNFVGTTDNQPLELHVNSARALRVEPGGPSAYLIGIGFGTPTPTGAPNMIGGASINYVSDGVVGAVIAGGGATNWGNNIFSNSVTADFGIVGGGSQNTANGQWATVGGGLGNSATQVDAMVGGGYYNTASGLAAFVGGGYENSAIDYEATVSGGYGNTAMGFQATVGGGNQNTASNQSSTVSGGYLNTASGIGSFVGGGGIDGTKEAGNQASGIAAVAVGGLGNSALAGYTAVGGGYSNVASGIGAFAGGGGFDGTTQAGNQAGGAASVVVGGLGNSATNSYDTVGGGYYNLAGGPGGYATVGGGQQNTASGNYATVSGGSGNSASALLTTISGGVGNIASNQEATVAGGYYNTASGAYSTVAGGELNVAQGAVSFAAGENSLARDHNSFVWGDGTRQSLSQGANTFNVLATGGVYFYTYASNVYPWGAYLAANSTSWAAISDRNAKKNFVPVDCVAIVEKLAAIPISRWNYKWEQDTDTLNIGPMAQDFKPAFYPGRDDKSITTLEFDGVELAAIKGLNEKLEGRSQKAEAGIQKSEARIQTLETENAKLKTQVADLQSQMAWLQRAVARLETKSSSTYALNSPRQEGK